MSPRLWRIATNRSALAEGRVPGALEAVRLARYFAFQWRTLCVTMMSVQPQILRDAGPEYLLTMHYGRGRNARTYNSPRQGSSGR